MIDVMVMMVICDVCVMVWLMCDVMFWMIEEFVSVGVDVMMLWNLLLVGFVGEGVWVVCVWKCVWYFFLLSVLIVVIEGVEGEETEKSLEAYRDAMARARDVCF